MDSKSVHRVAESMNVKSHFDSKIKLWQVGGLSFSADEIAKMPSRDLRDKLAQANGQKVVSQSARQFIAESSDGNQPVRAALDIVKRSGGNVTKAIEEHKANGGQKPKREKKVKPEDEGKERVSLHHLAWIKQKPKRVEEGKLHLGSVGIHKWAMRKKMETRGASKEIQDVAAKPTMWYTRAEMRLLAKGVFDEVDREVLAHPERYTEKAVEYAEECKMLAAAMLELEPVT